jgi:outer membrane receptor protein involved in Fe transport
MIISLLSKKKYAVYPNKYLKLITFLIVFLSINKISKSQAQSGTITVSYKNCTAQQLLKELDRQSPYTFFFDPVQMSGLQLQNIMYKDAPVKTVLEDLEKRTNLSFSTLNSNISVRLVMKVPVKKPEPGKLTGKISDEKAQTFPSAAIRVLELFTGMQSSVDGTYTLSLPPGTYTIEISYVSYQTQRITGVQIKAGAVTRLDVSMKPAANALKEVVVTSGFQRASAAGLYARQKNAAGITDGISEAQIARTPDNNVGAVLKRVSGLNVVDNRYVVVRGLSDRYNQAQIDGVTQPSTEMNQRNFAFDAIPAEMVSSVVVNKTATPDISSEFAGGQVSVNTLDIPVQDFTQFQIGTGYNTNAIGKDFLQAGKRGGAEVFGFPNAGHKLAPGLKGWTFTSVPVAPDYVTAQSRSFDPEGFRMYRYGFQPNQNYRLTLGRVYPQKNDLSFGFVGGATLRNSQEINKYISTRLGFDDPGRIDDINIRQNGMIYKYNSTLSGLLNFGLQGKAFKLSFRNMYSHTYKNNYYTYESADPNQIANPSPDVRIKFNLQDPESTTVLQHKLEGEHNIGESGIKLSWNGSYTSVKQHIDDRRRFIAVGSGSVNGTPYFQRYIVSNPFVNDGNPDYRLYMETKEKDYNWGTNLSKTFDFLNDKTLVKLGYSGFNKNRNLSNTTAEIYNLSNGKVEVGPYEYSLRPELLGTGPGQIFYFIPGNSGSKFSGKATSSAVYAMLDQRFLQKIRLVYGIRIESFRLANTNYFDPDSVNNINRDNRKNYLPSANATYSLTEKMNIRASYATTVVRPDFRETSIFSLYDPVLDARIEGSGVVSTTIRNTDLRYEWYPAAGEIISVSGFYKKFDQPIELVFLQDGAVDRYAFQNQRSATNYGLEMEIRKSLGFIAHESWLKNLTIFGNGTLIRSKVVSLVYTGPNREIVNEFDFKRPLFGQSPWIVNAGIAYTKDQYGVNLVYNKSGRRTNTIRDTPDQVEYEMGRDLVDLQLFTRLFKQKAELKLNISNLLNTKTFFYKNWEGYTKGASDTDFIAKPGTSDKYNKDEGDYISYKVNYGTNISMAFTYRF